jgi:hypothetical protein
MDDDLDFTKFELDTDVTGEEPTFRATIVGRRLTLVHWMPFLISGGPVGELLAERASAGVSIADLTVIGDPPDREVVVSWLAAGDLEVAERVLVRWAQRTAHCRVWFPDRLVEIPLTSVGPALAVVRCSNCRAIWRDRNVDFWAMVASRGPFPTFCPLCGGDLRQWSARQQKVRGKMTAHPIWVINTLLRQPALPSILRATARWHFAAATPDLGVGIGPGIDRGGKRDRAR